MFGSGGRYQEEIGDCHQKERPVEEKAATRKQIAAEAATKMREEDVAKRRWIAKEAAEHCHRDIASIGFMARLPPILQVWCGAVRTSPIILMRSPLRPFYRGTNIERAF